MKKVITIVAVFLGLVFIVSSCKTTKECPAYGQNVQIEEIQNV
jgi:predicted small secreted protein